MSRKRIAQLRALAASTTFPAERESALAKAAALEAKEPPPRYAPGILDGIRSDNLREVRVSFEDLFAAFARPTTTGSRIVEMARQRRAEWVEAAAAMLGAERKAEGWCCPCCRLCYTDEEILRHYMEEGKRNGTD